MITTILFDLWETLATKRLLIFDTLVQDFSVSNEIFPFFVEQLLKLETAEINEDQFWQNMRQASGADNLGTQVRLVDIYRKITILNEELINSALNFKSKGGKIAIFSNTDPAARDYLREINLLDKFDESFFSFDFKLLKPDQKFIENVLTNLDIDAQNVAYFDDNPKCIKAAQHLGVHGFVYNEHADAISLLNKFSKEIINKM